MSLSVENRWSLFTSNEKRYIVAVVAFAGWFSTLSSFIYYPVITVIAQDLGTTVGQINLTVTSYLIVSAIAPAFAGDAADTFGRRPLLLLTLVLYFGANIGIALQDSFVALLLLRMVQSAGISGSFSIAYGIIGDISTPAERGSYVSALSLGITTAPSLGPLFGGALGYHFGWRSIFWFLCIASGVCIIMIGLTLPETARNLVDDGGVAPPRLLGLPFPHLLQHWKSDDRPRPLLPNKNIHVPNPMRSLRILFRRDTLCLIIAGAIIYMLVCCTSAALSTLFIDRYKVNQLQAGLIYLPFSLGSTSSTLISGRLIDRDYRKTAERHGLEVRRAIGNDLTTFPIEEARTRSIFVPIGVLVACQIGFGWAVEFRTHISIPLIIQFINGFAIQFCFIVNNTFIVDINQDAPASAQAASNIVRCLLSAIAVAVLQFMFNGIGIGWTFTILGCFGSISAGFYALIRRKGKQWRLGSQISRNYTVSEDGARSEVVEQSASVSGTDIKKRPSSLPIDAEAASGYK